MKLVLRVLWGMLLVTAMTGCSKVTQENYDRLKMGMSYPDVIALLGEPERCDSTLGIKNCMWGKEPKTITIKFAGDTTVFYSSEGLSQGR